MTDDPFLTLLVEALNLMHPRFASASGLVYTPEEAEEPPAARKVRERPFVRFMVAMQDLYNVPGVAFVFRRVLLRIIGTDPRAARRLWTDEEASRVREMSFDALAEEALGAKYA